MLSFDATDHLNHQPTQKNENFLKIQRNLKNIIKKLTINPYLTAVMSKKRTKKLKTAMLSNGVK